MSLLLAGSLLGGGLTHQVLKTRFGHPEAQVRPLPLSLEFFRRIAVGQDALASDLIVISLSQYFVRPASERDADWMAHMLDVATDLDKTNLAAWLFARNLMGFRDEDRRASLRILRKGMRLYPNTWEFGLWAALRYIELEDYEGALETALEAAKVPGAPTPVQRLPAFILARKGSHRLAVDYLFVLLKQASSEEERDLIRMRILWMERAKVIEDAAEQYHAQFGSYPTDPEDLVSAGFLKTAPEEPFGYFFRISVKGKVYSEWVRAPSGNAEDPHS
jgi:tetratricopeptide (TPR) repeat protein